MPAFRDLTNMQVGKLLVLSCFGQEKRRYYVWRCRCECGNIAIVRSQYLCEAMKHETGGTRSCGCLPRVRKPTNATALKLWQDMAIGDVRTIDGLTSRRFQTQVYQWRLKHPECVEWRWTAKKINEREIEVRRIR